jgi:hypothetical protein
VNCGSTTGMISPPDPPTIGESGPLEPREPAIHDALLHAELWVSLASLLRSYTAAHGLNQTRQATVELGENKMMVRCGENWLALDRNGAIVAWKRENGNGGTLELTEHGRLRGSAIEEELDLAAEAWARELMGA